MHCQATKSEYRLSRHIGNRLDGQICVSRRVHFVRPGGVLDEHEDVVTNPLVIFAILSPSTEQADRGRKFAEYRRLESLRPYVLVSLVEHYGCQPDGSWVIRLAEAGLESAVELVYP